MKHFHWFKKVGDWNGYHGLKMCRCGMHKLYDLYGFKRQPTEEQYMEIIAELREEAGR